MKTKTLILKLESNDDIQQIVKLAKPLWLEHYSSIIGESQVLYMLDKFQSFSAIKSQLEDKYQYFLVIYNKTLIGYFSLQYQENSNLFISKFYLSKNMRGKGIGKFMLAHIEELAIKKAYKTIDLTVNKNNPSIEAYLRLGFIKENSVQFDIGGGYIMDDYLMRKVLHI